MVLVKILGGIDLLAGFMFLLLTFNITPLLSIVLFCSGLLFLKGLFAFTGEPLSFIDLISAALLLSSLLFALPAILLWIPTFLLFAKGIVSFI